MRLLHIKYIQQKMLLKFVFPKFKQLKYTSYVNSQ